uniref:Uncharacterized protein n=1 Tax=mine drainage metagenome TaxID=410659 RepID=E6QMK6_9ZZZZ
MRVSKNWREMIPDHFSTYVSELIEDWSQLSIDDPNTLIRMLRELSVGPIRTLEEGSIPGSALNDLLIKYLGHGVT